MNHEFKISLTAAEINAILEVLGNQPTMSGLYPLMMKVKNAADAQVIAAQVAAATPAPEPIQAEASPLRAGAQRAAEAAK